MTKEQTIDMLIDDYKNGNQSAMSDYCNETRCDDCLFESGDCVDEVNNMLIDRLLKTEEHQETNLEHYWRTSYEVDDGESYLISVDSSKWAHDAFHSGDIRKWLLSPYEEPKFKLAQFEYDLLKCYDVGRRISEFWLLDKMHKKGYFKGVPDDIPINKILANCEETDE